MSSAGPAPARSIYSRLLNQVALPAYDRLRGRSYSRIRAFVEDSQWWSRDQLAEFQNAELHKLLQHAFDKVPHYRKKFEAAGISPADIRDASDLKKVPILERGEIREHLSDLCSTAFTGRMIPHATGGSSGTPTRFFLNRESYDWRTAVTERAYSWAGAILGEPVLYLWGAPTGTPSQQKRAQLALYRRMRGQYVINTFTQAPGFWDDVLDQAQALQPQAIVAYASNIEPFCRAAMRRVRRISSLRSVLAAAEPVHPELYNVVREALGVPLFNTYGSREFMSIAVECPTHNGLHVNSENVLLENIDDGSGARELLVTDLHNYAMPFIRYRIGDCASIDTTPCDCGRGLLRISKVDGRVVDLLRGANGRVVPGELIPHIMKDVPEVIEFQAQQTAPDTLVLRLIFCDELSTTSRDFISSEVRKAFGDAVQIQIERVSEIPKRPSGKRRIVIGLDDRT
jgi:phenylacetate-CoA ligase